MSKINLINFDYSSSPLLPSSLSFDSLQTYDFECKRVFGIVTCFKSIIEPF